MVLLTAHAPRNQLFDANLNIAMDCHWQAQSVAIILFRVRVSVLDGAE